MSSVIDVLNSVKFYDDYILTNDGDHTVGFKLMLPEVFAYSTNEANNLTQKFINLINSAPIDTFFHFQHFIYQGNYISEFNEKLTKAKIYDLNYYNDRPVMRHYCNLYVTYPGTKTGKSKYSKLDYLTKDVLKDIDKRIEEVGKLVSSLSNYLIGMDEIQALRMNTNELEVEFAKYIGLNYNKEIDSLSADPMYEDYDVFLIGNQYTKVISLTTEGNMLSNYGFYNPINPKTINDDINFNNKISAKTSMMYPLGIGLAFDHILNIGIKVLDNEVVKNKINRENRSLTFSAAINMPQANEKKQVLDEFVSMLDKNNIKACEFFVNVIINDSDRNAVNKKADYVKQSFLNMNSSNSWIENKNIKNLFISNAPGLVRNIDKSRMYYSAVEMASCYLHNETYYRTNPEGMLAVDRHGTPLNINIRNFKGKTNNNMLVFGPSGTGKSHWLQGFIDFCLSHNEQVILINVKPDYINSGLMNGCDYIETTEGKININPFYDVTINDVNEFEPNEDDFMILSNIISDIWKGSKGLSKEENSILHKYIDSYYIHVNKNGFEPSLKGFFLFQDEFIKSLSQAELRFFDFDSFKISVESYATGKDSEFLNSDDSFKLSYSKYIVFDLYGIKGQPEKFGILLNYIVHLSRGKVYRNKELGIFTNLIIDEAVDSMKGKAAAYVGEQFRVMRSLGGGICLATQGVTYFDGMDKLVRDSIFNNAQIKVILDHSSYRSDIPLLQEYCSINDHGIRLLNSISNDSYYREYLLVMGGSYNKVLRNEVSKETNVFYSTSNKEVKALEEEFQKTRSMVVAVENIVNQNLK